MKRVCTICARGGSKGVKNKNVRVLDGKPLIAHSILQAKASHLFECIVVSSDSSEILETANKWGADFLVERPDDMASDRAAKLPAIQHCASEAERLSGQTFETFVDLDATSPLRKVEDIQGSVDLLEKGNFSNVITGAPARRSPYFNLVERDENGGVHLAAVKTWKAATVSPDINVRTAIETINQSSLQAIFIVDERQRLLGIVSDRDVRHAMLKQISLDDSVQEIMNKNPIVFTEGEGEDKILDIFQETNFRFIPIVNAEGHITKVKTMDTPVVRRQDAPLCFDMNASIYVWNRHTMFHTDTIFTPGTRLFEMPEERSVDIDSEQDFKWVQFLMEERSKSNIDD